MEFTADNLEKVVTLFYTTEAGQQAEAHQWLTEAQRSTQAWSFVWDLLRVDRSSDVQFFAASTLHSKLQKNWDEIPVSHYDALRKQILDAIVSFAAGPKIVLNRLCIALSTYIIKTLTSHWPNAFEELVSSFQPQHLPSVQPERVLWILLEILTVTPEEFQTTTLSISQKNKLRVILRNVSKDILRVVEMCFMPVPNSRFDMRNLTTYINASRCASAWIQLSVIDIDECLSLVHTLIELTSYVYWNRADPSGMSSEEIELSEMTIETLTTVIQHPNNSNYKKHVLGFTREILDKFGKILESERNSQDPNRDIVSYIYGLIVTTADTHSKIFIDCFKSVYVEEQTFPKKLFETILSCTDLPGCYPTDETNSIITLGFWYTLQDEVLSLDTVDCARALFQIKPYYRNLITVMLRKSMFPSGSQWTLDDKEVFRCYRQDVADTFMYCYNVLNIEMLDILNTKLNEALDKSNKDGTFTSEYWNEIETCLHAYSAISECIELENLYLPKLMVTLKNIPYSQLPTRVLASALETVGAYSEWITEHPEMLENVVPLILSGLGVAAVSPSATMALKDVTQNCCKHLQLYGDVILAAAQNALQNGNLKLTESLRLVYSIGKVLGTMPLQKVMEYLNVIFAPSFDEIQRLLNSPSDLTVAANITTRLKMLSTLFFSLYSPSDVHVSGQQATLIVTQNTMPLYKEISEKYYQNTEIIEGLCALFKHIVTNLMEESKVLIRDILQIIVDVYKKHPQSSLLDLARTCVVLFSKDEDIHPVNQQLMQEIIETTLQMCAHLSSIDRLQERSDVLEGFFNLLSQISKRAPYYVLNSNVNTAALFQCATLCLALPETPTLKVCTAFLVNFITQSRETAQVEVVQNYGEALVMRLLINLGTAMPRSSGDIVSELLLALNKKYCDNLARWLQTLLAQDGFPSSKINKLQKDNFIKFVLREKANKRKLCDVVNEFMLISRGILRTEDTPI